MINCAAEKRIGKKGKIGKSTDERVHVENPVEGVDLGEGGDVHWEAAIREDDSEHFLVVSFGKKILLSSSCKKSQSVNEPTPNR